MTADTQVIGRTRTVLVSGRGDSQRAVISSIVARRIELHGEKKRLHFCGSVKFSDSVQEHIRDTILPIVERIVERLELPQISFEISAVNLAAASALDMGVRVSGLSADVPVFIAMLSEALGIPLSDDFVSTGHIASVEGDISAVKGIPAKLEAAKNDGTIRRFIYGDIEKDKSLGILSPNQRDRSIDAIMAVRDSLVTRAVSGIGELVREIFTEQDIVLASLREDFFSISKIPDHFSNPLLEAVGFLTDNNPRRFWGALQNHFLAGRCQTGKELLRAYAQFFIGKQGYPAGFGARLFQLICSLPPAVRRLKVDFPVLDKGLCVELNKLARETDYEDIPVLFDAAYGRNISAKPHICPVSEPPAVKADECNSTTFDTVIAGINQQALAQQIGIPIDSARGSYVLASSTVGSYEEFVDTVQAYYVHMQSHFSANPTEAPDMTKARSEAIALLEKAFYDKGGDRGAFVRARDGTEGGMRTILDILTECYKAQKQEAYIQMVFRDAIAALDWDERVKCIQAMIKRLGAFLPEEIKDQPTERFARDYETIVRAYVKQTDKINQLLFSM